MTRMLKNEIAKSNFISNFLIKEIIMISDAHNADGNKRHWNNSKIPQMPVCKWQTIRSLALSIVIS